MIDLELMKRLDADWDGTMRADSDFARQDRRVLLREVERLRNTEAWDEVERLRGAVERLELEKFDLAERLMKAGSDPT